MQLKPMNRHLLVERIRVAQEEGDTVHGILLPKEYKPRQDRYCLVNLVDFASDCNSVGELIRGQNYIVNATMIEEVEYQGANHSVILENHVVARCT
jgi:co-chaperonin GroES (HSP10)